MDRNDAWKKVIDVEDDEETPFDSISAINCDFECDYLADSKRIIEDRDKHIAELLGINLEREKIYNAALEKYGEESQINMLFEEMAELQKELCKYLRGQEPPEHKIRIAEEIADVEIMLEQMKLLFGLDKAVRNHKEYKVYRLKKRLTSEIMPKKIKTDNVIYA